MPRIFPEYVPIATPREQSVTLDPPVYADSPAFDFDEGEFKFTPSGSLQMFSQKEALAEWIRKTLVTPRFVHGIYPDWYGSEILNKIGGGDPQKRMSAGSLSLSIIGDIERDIRDCLLVDRRIVDVGEFKSVFEGDHIITTFTVLTTLGPLANLNVVTEI